MEYLFGAAAKKIHSTHIDHLCLTLTPQKVECLLRAAGGDWLDLLDRTIAKQAEARDKRNPGLDPRFKE